MEVRNKRLSDEEFLREREEVLGQWPTGKEVDLDEAIEYHKSIPPSKNYALKLAKAKRDGVILLDINSGRSTVESQSLHYPHEEAEGTATDSFDLLKACGDTRR